VIGHWIVFGTLVFLVAGVYALTAWDRRKRPKFTDCGLAVFAEEQTPDPIATVDEALRIAPPVEVDALLDARLAFMRRRAS